MPLTFATLCQRLQLTYPYQSTPQLNALIAWCRKNMSQDIVYSGVDAKRYHHYWQAAKNYLTCFLPRVTSNTCSPIRDLNDLNLVQYAALHGYHYFLSSFKLKSFTVFNLANEMGMTPLHLAALKGHYLTAMTLLQRGARADYANKDGQFALHSALILPIFSEKIMKRKKIKLFRQLKNNYPQAMDKKDHHGDTIAHLIATYGFSELISELQASHSKLAFTKNNYARYPIHLAILHNQLVVVQKLITWPFMTTLEDNEKRRSLHYAARYGTELMLQACIKKSDINRRDKFQKTPLMLAVEAGNITTFLQLIDQGADPYLVDKKGFTILHHALLTQNRQLIALILEHTQLDLNVFDDRDKLTLLYPSNLNQLSKKLGAKALSSKPDSLNFPQNQHD